MQIDPIKPALKAHGSKRLELIYDGQLSNFAFKFNLRRYNMGTVRGSCGGGCACEEFTIDANWEHRSSELSLHTVGYVNKARHHTGFEAKASCLLTHAGASLFLHVPLSLSLSFSLSASHSATTWFIEVIHHMMFKMASVVDLALARGAHGAPRGALPRQLAIGRSNERLQASRA